jgi:hypothetical protein
MDQYKSIKQYRLKKLFKKKKRRNQSIMKEKIELLMDKIQKVDLFIVLFNVNIKRTPRRTSSSITIVDRKVSFQYKNNN